MPYRVMKDNFGKAIATGFYGIEVNLGNNSDSDLLIEGFVLAAGSQPLPSSSLSLLMSQTRGDKTTRLCKVGFEGNLVVARDTQKRTLLFIPRRAFGSRSDRTDFDVVEIQKQITEVRPIVRKIEK